MSDQKPREFKAVRIQYKVGEHSTETAENFSPPIHVIEKSAYDALVKHRIEMTEMLTDKHDSLMAARADLDLVSQKLNLAIEAMKKELDAMGEGGCCCGAEEPLGEGYTGVICYLHDALAKLQESKD